MSDLPFDRDMSAIAARAAYPATPSLRAGVLTAIDAPQRTMAVHRRAPVAFAAGAVAAVVACVAIVAVPTSRSAVAEFFGIEGSEVEPLPSSTPLPPPDDVADKAQLTTVDDANVSLRFELALPEGKGEPGGTYLVRYGTQSVAILRYDEFDLWEARLLPDANFGKGVPPGVTITDTFVGDAPARWISGGPHIVEFRDATGEPIEESIRTAQGNTLIWNDGQTFFRMETALTLDQAREIAESIP
jgi:hypothetical protein